MPNKLSPNEAKILQLSVELTTTKRKLTEALALVSQDALTGLASRFRIMEDFEHHLGIYRRERMSGEKSPSNVSAFFIDLDGFKPINDDIGHSSGDEALRQFAGYLTASIREGDIAGRTGGDEFVILTTGLTKEGARKLAMKIEEGLKSFPIMVNDKTFYLGASIGVASTSEGFETRADLLHEADMRMLDRKKKKKAKD